MSAPMLDPDDQWTLGEAKDWLRAHLKGGAHCPCCTQYARVYHRRFNSGMARVLIAQWRTHGRSYAHTARLVPGLREGAKCAYWGLMESEVERREDGGRSGYWRITDLGQQFVLGEARIPAYANVYDDRVMSLDYSETLTIIDALGQHFRYDELMEDQP